MPQKLLGKAKWLKLKRELTEDAQKIWIVAPIPRQYNKKVKAIEDGEEIEKIIERNLKSGWKISRISKASLTILKLAIFEMKYRDDVPHKVAINEAVELAKRYGCDDDPHFVNGLLASVYKETV